MSLEHMTEVTLLPAGTTVDGYSGKSSRILMPQLDIYEKRCIEFYLSRSIFRTEFLTVYS